MLMCSEDNRHISGHALNGNELKLGDAVVWRDKREYVSAVRVER